LLFHALPLLQVKLNTDESPNTASTLGIRSIPTVIIFKGGKKCDTIIGAVPLSTLTAAVEKVSLTCQSESCSSLAWPQLLPCLQLEIHAAGAAAVVVFDASVTPAAVLAATTAANPGAPPDSAVHCVKSLVSSSSLV
jgi:thioredoxin-like negative regulator of GroEL